MRRLLSVIVLWLTVLQTLGAQSIRVSGKIVDNTGEPVPGVLVADASNSKNAAVSTLEGTYDISTSATATLSFSCLGFKTQNIQVGGRTLIDVIMETDAQVLDDVIVVAFGTSTKESFTGSAAVVKSDKIAARSVSDPLTALNGQVAGLQVVEGNGPTSSPSLLVRGFSSINAGTSPLIVVDGLPYSGYWSDINPSDVESISVLKDAASNALYGARGANGVIMITTKSAKRGEAKISFDAKWGLNTDGKVYYDVLSTPGEYYQAYYKALYNYYRNERGSDHSAAHRLANATLDGPSANGGLVYMVYNVPEGQYLIGETGSLNPNATLGNKISYGGQEYLLTPDNWKKEGIRNGFRQEYNLNISGGSEAFRFLASMGYVKNEGLTYGSDYTRLTARAKGDYQARKWLKIGANATYTHNLANYMSNAFAAAYEIAPIYPLYVRDGNGNILTDSHGKVYDYGDGSIIGLVRPVYKNEAPLQTDILDQSVNSSNAFGLQGYADFTITDGLVFTVNGGMYDTENRSNVSANPYYGYYANTGGYVSTYHYRTYNVNTQQLLKYDKTFNGAHNVSLMLGHEYNRDYSTVLGAYKNKVFAYEVNKELDGAIIKSSIEGNTSDYNTEGYMFRGQYDYASKYFASVSYRRDGSSSFAPGHQWGNFWSLGGAWIMNKEAWFHASVFDMLKLKASYGKQGNDGIPDYYYTRQYNITSLNSEPATTFKSEGNEDITWETNANLNTGVEFEMLKRRLSSGLELYYRKTTDMLLWRSVPVGMGYSGYYDNVGNMANYGLEFNLSGEIVHTENVSLSANFNISHNTNMVTYLPDSNKSSEIDGHGGYLDGDRYIGEGLPIYTWYLKRYAGVDKTDGSSLWYYTDKSGQLQTTSTWDKGDYYLCGSPHPDVYGGLGLTLAAYGFDLSVNGLYSIGGLVFDGGYQTLMGMPYAGYTGYNIHRDALSGWSAENPDSNIPRLQYNDVNTGLSSDRWLTNGSSFTLKTITFGYTLPARWMKKLHVDSTRIFCSCENVAYWSCRQGLDPRSSLTGDASGSGYSPMRVFTGGVNLKF